MVSASRGRGFTLLEVIVVISVLIALAGFIVPNLGSIIGDSRTTQTAAVIDTLKKACTRYNLDTGGYASEYTGASYTAGRYHQLALPHGAASWDGPYLEEPLGARHNPWGGTIHLYNVLLPGNKPMGGWDLDLDGTAELTGSASANVLYMTGVPESSAADLDRRLEPAPAASVSWQTSGRLVYSNGNMWVLLLRDR